MVTISCDVVYNAVLKMSFVDCIGPVGLDSLWRATCNIFWRHRLRFTTRRTCVHISSKEIESSAPTEKRSHVIVNRWRHVHRYAHLIEVLLVLAFYTKTRNDLSNTLRRVSSSAHHQREKEKCNYATQPNIHQPQAFENIVFTPPTVFCHTDFLPGWCAA